jgi:hypothetical protein
MGILSIQAKCSDMCHISFSDKNTGIDIEHQGYVPKGIGIGGGDMIRLQIDTVTGKVLSAGLMTDADIIEAIENEK